PSSRQPCREIAPHSSAALASNSIFDGLHVGCMAGMAVILAAHAAVSLAQPTPWRYFIYDRFRVSRVASMVEVTYEIVEHDGGWAYKVDGVFSEPYPSHAAALAGGRGAAAEQTVPGHTETIEYEDEKGHWHTETARGSDRPQTQMKHRTCRAARAIFGGIENASIAGFRARDIAGAGCTGLFADLAAIVGRNHAGRRSGRRRHRAHCRNVPGVSPQVGALPHRTAGRHDHRQHRRPLPLSDHGEWHCAALWHRSWPRRIPVGWHPEDHAQAGMAGLGAGARN